MYQYLKSAEDGLLMRPAGAWAAVKLDYLRRYIDVFETSMRGKWNIRNYIDLLSGPGKNRVRQSNEILLGSPLIALETRHPFTGFYFIDYDQANTDALRERCKASSLNNTVKIATGDCNLLVDDVVQELKPDEHKSINLAFLDPEGLELHWITVEKLASIRRMDLIINYPQNGLSRVMAKDYKLGHSSLVDLFFGTPAWRVIYANCKNKGKLGLHRELIDLYKEQLCKLGYKYVLRGDETGGDEPLMINTQRKAPLYRLIFASKNQLGEEFWHKVTKRDIYGQRRLFDS